MKDLLSIDDVTAQDIKDIFNFEPGDLAFRKKTVANLFYEPSTRTRLSFELAAIRHGADVITFDAVTSSEQKGENFIDTARTLQALGADVLVVRHSTALPYQIAQHVDCHVINAGDGINEHPTQALLDLYTMKEHFGRIAGLRVGIVGDIKHSRVAHSLYKALAKMGAETTLVGPKGLVSSRPGPYMSYDLDAVLPTLDVCYVLRAQTERHSKDYYFADYRLTVERADTLPDHAIVMHPGPMNRGVEIDSDVADADRSVILDQVRNGVTVRAAVLYWLMTGR